MISYTGENFLAISYSLNELQAYFNCECAETAIWELPVKNLTPTFAPRTLISYKTGGYISTIRWGLRHTFDVSVHNFILPCDPDLRLFDLGSV